MAGCVWLYVLPLLLGCVWVVGSEGLVRAFGAGAVFWEAGWDIHGMGV